MSRLCPHCRFPFDPDWGDEPLPTLCPRCGQRLAAPSANNPRAGIAAFLHKPSESATEESLLRTPLPTREANAATEAPAATPKLLVDVRPQASSVSTDKAAPVTRPADDESLPPIRASSPALEVAPSQSTTPSISDRRPARQDAAPELDRAAPTDKPTPAAPTFARAVKPPASSPRSVLIQSAIVVVLVLLLVLQLLLSDRNRLGANAQWRPLLLSVCGVLGCQLNPWREPQALTMLSRDVRPSPSAPGVLNVRGEFRNDARWAQAMPALQLTLSDADGRRVGQRVFNESEYLSASSTTTLAPGQTRKFSFDIREPVAPPAAFQFEFR